MILERFFGAILSESVTEQKLGTCAIRQRRRRRGNANRIVSGDIDMGGEAFSGESLVEY